MFLKQFGDGAIAACDAPEPCESVTGGIAVARLMSICVTPGPTARPV